MKIVFKMLLLFIMAGTTRAAFTVENDLQNCSSGKEQYQSQTLENEGGGQTMQEILSVSSYNKDSPFIHDRGGAAKVKATLLISSTPKVNEILQELSFTMYVILSWHNEWFKNIPEGRRYSLHKKLTEDLWTPGVFINVNQRTILHPPVGHSGAFQGLYIFSNGEFSVQASKEMVISCAMNFQYYPAEILNCTLKFDIPSNDDFDPVVQVNYTGEAENPDYYITFLRGAQFNESYICSFEFRRKLGFHILQTYIPSSLLVILSWLSLLIKADCISDRLALCTTTLLTLTALFNSVRQDAPKVSYVKAIDIWIVFCVGFVFFVVLENILILNVIRQDDVSPRCNGIYWKMR